MEEAFIMGAGYPRAPPCPAPQYFYPFSSGGMLGKRKENGEEMLE